MDIFSLFGGATAARCLLFIAWYEEATSGEIAQAFAIAKPQVFLQLAKLEKAGVLSCRRLGNSKVYSFNPRSGLKSELSALCLKYVKDQMPKSEFSSFYLIRRRPRAAGKPLGGAYAKQD
jgi:DNA-binding transcriptional ArsR family regulator